jgi:hypothetical protein
MSKNRLLINYLPGIRSSLLLMNEIKRRLYVYENE